jgi:hypothetical protein
MATNKYIRAAPFAAKLHIIKLDNALTEQQRTTVLAPRLASWDKLPNIYNSLDFKERVPFELPRDGVFESAYDGVLAGEWLHQPTIPAFQAPPDR